MGSCNQYGGGGGDFISKLPSEILFEILLRVPIKALSDCRFVCKSWFHTIQNPNFRAAYDTNTLYLILHSSEFQQDSVSHHLVDLDFVTSPSPIPHPLNLPPNTQLDTIKSCNGFLLLEWYLEDSVMLYCIFNPITGDHVAVPLSELHNDYSQFTGFGYDPFSQVCKIIRIMSSTVEVEIYNLVTDEWRIMEEDQLLIKSFCPLPNDEQLFMVDVDLFAVRSTYLNGALHWIGSWKGTHLLSIISFRLDSEEFYQIPLFPGLNLENVMLCSFLVVGECLSILLPVNDQHVECWVMNDYGLESSWEKKYVIPNITMDEMDDGYPVKVQYSPIVFMQNGELLCSSFDGRLGCYHLVTKAFRSLESEETWYSPFVHVASLKSPASISK